MGAERVGQRSWSRPLLALAAVFLVVAVWNGVLAVTEEVAWRGGAAAGCAVASVSLLCVAAADRWR
ncbi:MULTISPECIES: hypothetical protein [Actinosynnema]|uniref:hypothetical protein n=1 Tax=Actinosynnema TaxID=40566 RepID=UPI0020A3630E|nr:hypothetical protein [Actinosynnema pretiosum]